MSATTLEVLIVVVGSILGAAMIAAGVVWTLCRGDVHQRALRQTAREAGVSEDYLEAVLLNNADLAEGRISADEWKRRAMRIAYRFPRDSGIREMLRASEFAE
jgi:hypothetical protein